MGKIPYAKGFPPTPWGSDPLPLGIFPLPLGMVFLRQGEFPLRQGIYPAPQIFLPLRRGIDPLGAEKTPRVSPKPPLASLGGILPNSRSQTKVSFPADAPVHPRMGVVFLPQPGCHADARARNTQGLIFWNSPCRFLAPH